MFLSLDIWLLPAIAAASSSYLVTLIWERIRPSTAPSGLLAALLSGLSFLMGGFGAYYRHSVWAPSPENNIIIMFAAGAITTFAWLALRRFMPGFPNRSAR